MIGYYPVPYKDELFYSVNSRYKRHTLGKTKDVCSDLFGKAKVTLHPIYPQRLKFFVEGNKNLINDTVDSIIQNQTILELFRVFYSSKKSQDIIGYAINNEVAPGIMGGFPKVRRHQLKFCPLCRKNDIDTYGEPYWHRSHQILTLPLCVVHNCFLHTWDPPLWIKSRNFKFYNAQEALLIDHEVESNDSEILLADSKILVDLVCSNRTTIFQKRDLVNRAHTLKFLTFEGREVVLNERLFEEFNHSIPQNCLVYYLIHLTIRESLISYFASKDDSYINYFLLIRLNSFLNQISFGV